MAENTFAFRRYTAPLKVPVGPTASTKAVDAGFIKPEFNAFYVVNPNLCYVRLSGRQSGGATNPATEINSWLFPPGFAGVFSTQRPVELSAIAVARPGWPLPAEYADLELSYGVGA